MAHAVTAEALDTPLRMTFEEFLKWAHEDTRVEWVDGKVLFMSPVSAVHSNLVGFLGALLRAFAETRGLGRVLGPEYLLRLTKRPSGRVPDVLFVAQGSLGKLTPTYLDGPADLIVEVVSPDDPARDYVNKYGEYQQAGVREFWLIDPEAKSADFHVLDAAGLYERSEVGDDGIYRSTAMPGLWLNVEWLWQEPLPSLLSVLKEWGLV